MCLPLDEGAQVNGDITEGHVERDLFFGELGASPPCHAILEWL